MPLTAVFLEVPEGYVAFIEELPAPTLKGPPWRRPARTSARPWPWSSRPTASWPSDRCKAERRPASRSLCPHEAPRPCSPPGCAWRRLLREGRGHGVLVNPAANATSAVPRHTEINEFLARKICRDLQVPGPDRLTVLN